MKLKLLLLSDLHLEFASNKVFMDPSVGGTPDEFAWPNESEYDIAILAGDIGTGTNGVQWALEKFPHTKPVIYIPGNHEYYIKTPMDVLKTALDALNSSHMHILNPGIFEGTNYTIIGATLWSRGMLLNYPDTRELINRSINDFRITRYSHIDWFSVSIMQSINQKERDYLEEQIKIAHEKGNKVIVVTHFVPSQEFIDPKYVGDLLTPYFINDCDDLIAQADVWMAGHTHSRINKVHSSGTPVYINPLGYPGENRQPYPPLIIEV